MGSECSPSECDIRLHQITTPNEISSPNLLWFSLSSNAKFWHLHLWTYTTPAELQFTQTLIYATWLCFLTSYSIFGWLVLRFSSLYSCQNATPTVATPNPGNHDLNNPGFILQCFHTSDRKILFTYSYVKKKIPCYGLDLPPGIMILTNLNLHYLNMLPQQ